MTASVQCERTVRCDFWRFFQQMLEKRESESLPKGPAERDQVLLLNRVLGPDRPAGRLVDSLEARKKIKKNVINKTR